MFLGKPRETIRRWLRATGVTLRRRGPRAGVGVKLTPSDVVIIRQRLADNEPQAVIARDYPVSRQTIHLIDSGRIWTEEKDTACLKKDKRETPTTSTTRRASN